MLILELILLSVLLICAVVITAAVVLQQSNEGLSGSIAGGSETYYGKDKSNQKGKKLFKVTLIACIIFAIAVLVVYIIQPDYSQTQNDWQGLTQYSNIFSHKH
ncbi:MAG: preprotein translocase subunit SecG [Ruminococcaceae bacterium]|nr:preprotein translocase subunit SecG [Oscillospiraceae bacterium]